MPVFVHPLSAPIECKSGERIHFNACYEPIDDNKLQIKWFLNNRPLLTGSRVKTINEFGYVVLEVRYNYFFITKTNVIFFLDFPCLSRRFR